MSTAPSKSNSQASSASAKRSNKTRVVRRRGPVRDDGIDEGVIERAALTDEDSSQASDPDSELDEEDADDGPSATAKPPPASEPPIVQQPTPPPTDDTTSTTHGNSGPPSEEPSQLWSDAMADGKPAEGSLPVIDFTELSLVGDGQIETLLKDKSRKSKSKAKAKGKKAAAVASTPSVPSAAPGPCDSTTAEASTSAAVPASTASPTTTKPKTPFVSARQAYMDKITNDPSYVPRIGQFWGHDDRLMDKELRGMSDWWRGRWMGRGRGGGRGGRGGFGGRGRGRGGLAGGAESPTTAMSEKELEPIDTKWTHDGFDELMKDDAGSQGGKRGTARGRGWYNEKRGRGRGGANAVPSRPPTQNPTEVQAQLQAEAAAKMAQEQVAASSTPATPAARSSAGTPAPGSTKAGKKAAKAAKQINAKGKLNAVLNQAAKEREVASATSVIAAAKNDIAAEQAVAPSVASPPVNAAAAVKVNLPKSHKKRPQLAQSSEIQRTPNANEQLSVDQAAPRPSATAEQIAIAAAARTVLDLPQHQSQFPRHASDKERAEAMERAILKDSFRKPSLSASVSSFEPAQQPTSQPPVVMNAPLNTQPSTNPAYSYVALPPGIAMGESGLLYEIATGRPVVLNQPTPPLPPPPVLPLAAPPPMAPMYNPRPVMHPQAGRSGSMSFIPAHVMAPEYPATPPIYGGYPGSPTPGDGTRSTPNFFTPPKSSGRVQIRPPAAKATDDQAAKDIGQSQSSYRPPQEQVQQYQNYSQPSAPTYQPTAPEQYYNSYYSSSAPPPATNGYTAPSGTTEDPYYGAYYGQPPYGYPPAVDYGAYAQDGSYSSAYVPPPHEQQRQNPTQAYY